MYDFLHLEYVAPGVLEVRMRREKKRNAMTMQMWQEIGHCFSTTVAADEACRIVMLTGAGAIFSAGIDLGAAAGFLGDLGSPQRGADVARRAVAGVFREGMAWQRAWRSLSLCPKPVMACIHGGCYGAALEMVAFADIRWCTEDTVFRAPEIDLGFAADIGGNQMLPKVLGNDSLARELMMSGRSMHAQEAFSAGLVSRVCATREDMLAQATQLATTIASKSPVAVMGVKTMQNYSRDHSIDDALQFSITLNSSMIQTEDVKVAGTAFMLKKKPQFKDVPTFLHTPVKKAKL